MPPRLLAAAVERFGSGEPREPSLEEIVVLDAEVRAFCMIVIGCKSVTRVDSLRYSDGGGGASR